MPEFSSNFPCQRSASFSLSYFCDLRFPCLWSLTRQLSQKRDNKGAELPTHWLLLTIMRRHTDGSEGICIIYKYLELEGWYPQWSLILHICRNESLSDMSILSYLSKKVQLRYECKNALPAPYTPTPKSCFSAHLGIPTVRFLKRQTPFPWRSPECTTPL